MPLTLHNKIQFDNVNEPEALLNDHRFSFTFLKDDQELQQYYTIREQCYRDVKNGPEHFDGSEDEFDRSSDTLIVKVSGRVVGGARVNGFSFFSGKSLPLEGGRLFLNELFESYQLEKNGYCEFSRLAINKEYRSHLLLKKILFHLSLKAAERRYKYLFAMSPMQQARCYRLMFQALKFPNSYTIYKDLNFSTKGEDECGALKMYLASLELPVLENKVLTKL